MSTPTASPPNHHQQPLSLSHALNLLAPLFPPAQTRAWLSAPHPTLPLIATCSSDRCVRIYSLRTFRLHSTIEGGHKRSIRTCAWKPTTSTPLTSSSGEQRSHEDGGGESVLVTGSFDASAGVWRRWNEGVIEQSVLNSQHPETTNDDEDENSDSEDGWRFAVILEGHDSEIKSVGWSCAGNFLATCSRDKSVWIWEDINDSEHSAGGGGAIGGRLGGGGGGGGEDDFETVAVLQDHEADVKCVAWHPSDNRFLASASYDETIRLYREDEEEGDWLCVAVLRGHEGTVWFVDWEGAGRPFRRRQIKGQIEDAAEDGRRGEARLISCSDDLTIRVWRRQTSTANGAPPAEGEEKGQEEAKKEKKKYPSTIRPSSHSTDEEWIQECILPQRHDRAVYCVSWSKRSGRVVSTGGDGKIVVYEERSISHSSPQDHGHDNEGIGNDQGSNNALDAATDSEKKEERTSNNQKRKEWVVTAEIEAAHGVFEINHVCWAKRFDDGRRRGKSTGETKEDEDPDQDEDEEEEVIITTGDDGVVNVWTLDLNSEQVHSSRTVDSVVTTTNNASMRGEGDAMDVT